jgi:hypothetical protein
MKGLQRQHQQGDTWQPIQVLKTDAMAGGLGYGKKHPHLADQIAVVLCCLTNAQQVLQTTTS